ncbi:hypothetical protein K438DRAFT_753488 [Mycena galopus ATCC 62051]|nr:hypothetical protein K438DRAFT_753488 [Mycena galopus ATCC 62051]
MWISFVCVCVGGAWLGRLWRAFGAQREQPPERAKRAGTERGTAKPVHKGCKGKGYCLRARFKVHDNACDGRLSR